MCETQHSPTASMCCPGWGLHLFRGGALPHWLAPCWGAGTACALPVTRVVAALAPRQGCSLLYGISPIFTVPSLFVCLENRGMAEGKAGVQTVLTASLWPGPCTLGLQGDTKTIYSEPSGRSFSLSLWLCPLSKGGIQILLFPLMPACTWGVLAGAWPCSL